jgi:hypothetical protein
MWAFCVGQFVDVRTGDEESVPSPVRSPRESMESRFRSSMALRSSSSVCAFSALSTFGPVDRDGSHGERHAPREVVKGIANLELYPKPTHEESGAAAPAPNRSATTSATSTFFAEAD